MVKVAKWGNSLAIRLPARLVSAMGLKEGDDVAIGQVGAHELQIERQTERQRTREEALASLRAMRVKLPDDWKFDREEANAR